VGESEDSTAFDMASNAYLHRLPFPPSLMKLLEKLASLVPPSRFNLVRYHRVLAPFSLNLRSYAIAALTLEVRVCLAIYMDVAPVGKIAHKADQRCAALQHAAAHPA